MIGYRTMVIHTTYPATVSFAQWQVADIKRVDVVEIRDKDSGELLAHTCPIRLLKAAKNVWCHDEDTGRKWPSPYLVSPFKLAEDFKPEPKKLRTILKKRKE